MIKDFIGGVENSFYFSVVVITNAIVQILMTSTKVQK